MMPDNPDFRSKVYDTLGCLKYQMFTGVTTCGPCKRCETGTARGSGVCSKCLKYDLTLLIGKELTDIFVSAHRALQEAHHKIEDFVDEAEEREL